MRLSDLLGCTVTGPDGTGLGAVTDVRLARVGRGPQAQLQVESLLVSPRTALSLFGYERRSEQGPAPLRAVIRRLHRHAVLIPWSEVEHWDRTGRHLRVSGSARLPPPTG
jgi:sporulation protein YlmC with PRC-barrel domain